MPPTNVERHLDAAREYIAIAESGDATRAAYAHAADEILSAQQSDSALTYASIARSLGRSHKYVVTLVRWRQSGSETATPFSHGGQSEHRRGSDRAATKRIARERPADFAEAFEQAPAEARREIAKQIAKSPDVRVEVAKHEADVVHKPTPGRKTDKHVLWEFEADLDAAYRKLRQAFEKLGGVDQPGDSEDILAQIERLRQIVDVIDEAYRTGKSIDTWAAELWEGVN